MTLLCAECRFLRWQRHNKSTSSVPITAHSRHATACGCSCRAENGLTITQYKKKQEIHAIGCTAWGLSWRVRSTSKLECVQMFRWFRSIRTLCLKELEISSVRSPQRDSVVFLMALMNKESRFQICHRLRKSTSECANNSELAAHYGIRVFTMCRNTAGHEKKTQ